MRIIVLDTETNGLPANRYISYTNTKVWPAIVQVAWEVWDIRFDGAAEPMQLRKTSLLVKPPTDLVWNEESAAIHGISRETAEAKGVPARDALLLLAADCRECDLAVIHNLAFDKNILWSAAHRLEEPELAAPIWWPKHELCTMLGTAAICKIPSTAKKANPADPYKWPRLDELWAYLFPETPAPQGLHDAGVDVGVLVRCFLELHRRRVLALPDIADRPLPSPLPAAAAPATAAAPESRFDRFWRTVLRFFDL